MQSVFEHNETPPTLQQSVSTGNSTHENPSRSTSVSAESSVTTNSLEIQCETSCSVSRSTTNLPQQNPVVSNEAVNNMKVVDDLVKQTVAYCKENEIVNPVEILRCLQKAVVHGRSLNVGTVNLVEQGSTNFILVDRQNILETSFDEIKTLKDLRMTLEVQFYGEVRKLLLCYSFLLHTYISIERVVICIFFYCLHD